MQKHLCSSIRCSCPVPKKQDSSFGRNMCVPSRTWHILDYLNTIGSFCRFCCCSASEHRFVVDLLGRTLKLSYTHTDRMSEIRLHDKHRTEKSGVVEFDLLYECNDCFFIHFSWKACTEELLTSYPPPLSCHPSPAAELLPAFAAAQFMRCTTARTAT